MKKYICFLLSVFFMLTAVSSVAEVDQEILFRGIPWGTSYDEAREIIKNTTNIEWYSGGSIKGCSTRYFIEHADFAIQIVSEYDRYTTYEFSSKEKLEVAGRMSRDTALMFAVLPNEDGVIYGDTWDTSMTSFCRAQYNYYDRKEVSDELYEKLLGLYGEPDETIIEPYYSYYINTYIWNGANNTFCAMKTGPWTGDYEEDIYIIYGTYDGDKLLEQANDNLTEKANKIEEQKKQSTDGL